MAKHPGSSPVGTEQKISAVQQLRQLSGSTRDMPNASPPCPLLCRFLGRLHDESLHTRRREASEKRQGTKSRLVGRRRCSGLYNGLIGKLTLITDGTRREEVERAFGAVVPPPD